MKTEDHIKNVLPVEDLLTGVVDSIQKASLSKREFGIIILCNKPAFINDVNIE